jgi:hypothetical protein
MTTERERKGIAGQNIDRDGEFDRVEEEDMDTMGQGDKLQNAVDEATKDADDEEEKPKSA